jgi:hypothetical protein
VLARRKRGRISSDRAESIAAPPLDKEEDAMKCERKEYFL